VALVDLVEPHRAEVRALSTYFFDFLAFGFCRGRYSSMNLRANSSTVGTLAPIGAVGSGFGASSGLVTRSTCIRSACSAAIFVLVAGVPVMRTRRPSGVIIHLRYRHRPLRLSR
jgi:hypothetical protein